jgi:hypothetical protein
MVQQFTGSLADERLNQSTNRQLTPQIVQEYWSGSTWFGILDRPVLCGLCGEMHSILANDGWTRCLVCWLEDAARDARVRV